MKLYTNTQTNTTQKQIRKVDTPKVAVDADFVEDLHTLCRSVDEVSKVCGVTTTQAKKLLSGSLVKADVLERAKACFYADRELCIGNQIRAVLGRGDQGSATVLQLLQQAARFVQNFRKELKIPEAQRPTYILPPRDTLLRLVLTCEECYNLLVEIQRQCPESANAIYAQADILRAQIVNASKRSQAQHESRLVHRKSVQQVQADSENADDTDNTVEEEPAVTSFTEADGSDSCDMENQ